MAGAPNVVRIQAAHPRGAARAAELVALAHAFLERMGLADRELSIALVGDRAIRRLNRTWRRQDKATDVLSFPAGESPGGVPGPVLLGDVVLSLDTAARAAREEGREVGEELARYLAHGLLHLLGYDHHRARDARRMARAEAKLLGAAGMVPPRRRARARPGALDSGDVWARGSGT